MRRVYSKEEVCIACRLCEIYCLAEHSKSRDLIKAYQRESPRALARIHVEEKGPLSLAVQCRHCQEPLCVYACLTGAMQKDPETGIVTLDSERCVGCWTCIIVCPYGAIAKDPQRGVVAKCNLCPRLTMPACVGACPNEALVYAEEDNA